MDLLSLMFPKICAGCGSEGSYLCKKCLKDLRMAELVCPECERPSFGGMTHPGCMHPYGMEGLVAIWKYEGRMKKAVGQLKFKFVKEMVNDLIEGVVNTLDHEEKYLAFRKGAKESIWVGIPLHYLRERWRGFNQADIIAGELARKIGGGFLTDVVERKEYTHPQVGLGEKERKENIAGAFSLNREVVGRRIILVDDVWTTGATMKELVKILKRRGARSVWGFVLAR